MGYRTLVNMNVRIRRLINSFKTRVQSLGGTTEATEKKMYNELSKIPNSILDKASIILTPNGVGPGKLFSAVGDNTNKVINGDFATDSDWYKTADCTIENGQLNIRSLNGSYQYVSQNMGLIVGKQYLMTYTVLINNAGGLKFSKGSGSYGFLVSNVGTHSISFTAEHSILYIERQAGVTDISINNVVIKDISQDMEWSNGVGTRVNKEGLIEDSPYNQAKHSEDFINPRWTKVANGTGVTPVVTQNYTAGPIADGDFADRLMLNSGAAGNSQIAQSIETRAEIGTAYTFSIWMKSNTVDTTVTMFNNNYTANKSVTTAWQRFTFTFASVNLVTEIRLAKRDVWGSSGAADLSVFGAQLVKGTSAKPYLKTTDRLNIPRIDYPAGGGYPHILVEPQRTNLNTFSNDFLNASYYNYGEMTIVSNAGTSPENVVNASKMTGLQGLGRSAKFFTTVIGTEYTFSIYVKNVDATVIKMFVGHTGAATIDYTNSINTSTWSRIKTTFTATSTTTLVQFVRKLTVGKSVLVYGAQLEVGKYATSYIPTAAATKTRLKDNADNCGSSDDFNGSEGTLFAEIRAFADDRLDSGYFSIDDGTNSNRFYIGNSASVNSKFGTVGVVAGALAWNLSSTNTFNLLEFHKVAVTYKLNEIKLYVNGNLEATDTVAPVFANAILKRLRMQISNFNRYGETRKVIYFKSVLTQQQIARL